MLFWEAKRCAGLETKSSGAPEQFHVPECVKQDKSHAHSLKFHKVLSCFFKPTRVLLSICVLLTPLQGELKQNVQPGMT